MRVHLQPAYVIHSRPYRDSSALLDVFTAEYGRVSVVARGARRQSRKGNMAALLQPFTPLLLSFSGRAELKTLVAAEAAQRRVALRAEQMFSGMYMNELMVRLLHRNDSHPALFAAYDHALKALAGSTEVDAVLRQFELVLLEELGYSFDLRIDAQSGQAVQATVWYRYEPGVGMLACDARYDDLRGNSGSRDGIRETVRDGLHDSFNYGVRDDRRSLFSGADLLAMAAGDFTGSARPAAKRLLRAALAVHLGDTSLRSRELFRAVSSQAASRGALVTDDEQPAGERS